MNMHQKSLSKLRDELIPKSKDRAFRETAIIPLGLWQALFSKDPKRNPHHELNHPNHRFNRKGTRFYDGFG
ncbi:MAG: hypothetical protein AAGA72_09300 [Pseudomonadota bacterium]